MAFERDRRRPFGQVIGRCTRSVRRRVARLIRHGLTQAIGQSAWFVDTLGQFEPWRRRSGRRRWRGFRRSHRSGRSCRTTLGSVLPGRPFFASIGIEKRRGRGRLPDRLRPGLWIRRVGRPGVRSMEESPRARRPLRRRHWSRRMLTLCRQRTGPIWPWWLQFHAGTHRTTL